MANEIRINADLQCDNGEYAPRMRVQNLSVTQAALGGASGVQEIGHAAHEAIDVGDVGTVGMVMFRNLGPTNLVQIGIDDTGAFVPFIKMNVNETAGPFRVAAGVALYAQATTAAVKIERMILEA
jgi:hypothetical protein